VALPHAKRFPITEAPSGDILLVCLPVAGTLMYGLQ
jgi:hypothetical protein